MKTYRGSPAAARHYVEADRGRADDYYLAEGTGIAQRYTASPDTGVRSLGSLSGDSYETWVAGYDPDTGAPRGRLRHDDQAVRFVEVVVNGPKSWSLAAELHPDISRAYDAAQDRAATQIIGWLAQHATTRVGPRGGQMQVPVAEVDAVTVRHYTSRAGDPHRHLHLQINARVFAEGQWRGLHTVGVRDSLEAINGIGHAAVMTDPGFRAALAAHGFTLDADTAEVTKLVPFVGSFSARAAQIGRNIDRYETQWRAANPGQEPGPPLRRTWDARAWADSRPDKVVPRDGTELTRRWVTELHALGYQEAPGPTRVQTLPIGVLDRDQAVREVVVRLGARRSGWNAADIRGEVEQLIARRNIVTGAGVRGELAEDLTARTLTDCIPLLERVGVPEHIRALTSRHVLDVEADLIGRLAARGTAPHTLTNGGAGEALTGLDPAQRAVVDALASGRQLVFIEGAAGAGKTTTLATARAILERQGGELMVVTPTLKAATVAAQQVGSRTSSAAWLAYQHGYRWHDHGAWTRLEPGRIDPDTGTTYAGPRDLALLRRGDLLLVDEAGMLDQDTARALLTIADEHHARLALVGDRHQLPAVGRGGVLDLAARWADPDACLTLDTVHRFTRTLVADDGKEVTVPDEEFARLSLAMRIGTDPGAVFDALLNRDQIRIHSSDAERVAVLAEVAVNALAVDLPTAIVADTREQVIELNAAIRERLIAGGRVDEAHATTTNAGRRIGVGDRVATRRNDRDLHVANRDTWTITRVGQDGSVTLSGEHGDRILPAAYVREHVELGYASTVHGVQGDTTSTAHTAVGDKSSSASAYVGMTRGRQSNVAHLVADSLKDAREQWVAVFACDRADLGPTHAADLAAAEANRYAQLRPLESVLADLHHAWSVEQDCRDRLERDQQRRDQLREIVPLRAARDRELPPLEDAYQNADRAARHAEQRTRAAHTVLANETERIRESLLASWDTQLDTARAHAHTVRGVAGRFGQRRTAATHASEQLTAWANTWRPIITDLPTTLDQLADRVLWFQDRPKLWDTVNDAARGQAEHAQPDAAAALAEATHAAHARADARRAHHDTSQYYEHALGHYGNLARTEHPEQLLTQLTIDIDTTGRLLAESQTSIQTLLAEPTLRTLPPERLTAERDQWRIHRDSPNYDRVGRLAQREADLVRDRRQPEVSVSYPAPRQSPGIRR